MTFTNHFANQTVHLFAALFRQVNSKIWRAAYPLALSGQAGPRWELISPSLPTGGRTVRPLEDFTVCWSSFISHDAALCIYSQTEYDWFLQELSALKTGRYVLSAVNVIAGAPATDDWLTVDQAAAQHGGSAVTWKQRCANLKVPGAMLVKDGSTRSGWRIPPVVASAFVRRHQQLDAVTAADALTDYGRNDPTEA